MKSLFLWVYLAIAVSVSQAAVYNDLSALTSKKSYDFIVVGGGTSGAVVANRLTENPFIRVLVVEDGPSNEGVFNAEIPGFGLFAFTNTIYDWNFTSIPQEGLGGRVINYQRGRMLGGSSSVNGMTYTRGSAADFDRFAAVTGDAGWSWARLQPYIRKHEHWTAPNDNHDTTGEFDPRVHGFHGQTFVSLPPSQPIAPRIVKAAKAIGGQFAYNLDYNSGNPLGISLIQATIGNGTRSSAATSYLNGPYSKRPNLDILVNTRALRLLKTGTGLGRKPQFRAVELTSGPDSPKRIVNAAKEVILAAGTIGTPHILLHSGIGDRTELTKAGVTPVLSLPSVGKNLTDHLASSVQFTTSFNGTAPPLNVTEALDQWNKTRTGPLAYFGAGFLGYIRIPDDSEAYKFHPDTSAGKASPHLEFTISGSEGPTATSSVVLMAPASRGSLTINSTNPWDKPIIDPGFLTNEYDVKVIADGLRTVLKFWGSDALKDYVVGPTGAYAAALQSQEALEAYIRSGSGSTAHPVGTAAMSARNAPFGVVDPDLLVKGAEGLSIVDASIMPFVTSGHTQAPVYILAERAADVIKERYFI